MDQIGALLNKHTDMAGEKPPLAETQKAAGSLARNLPGYQLIPQSLRHVEAGLAGMADKGDEQRLLIFWQADQQPYWLDRFQDTGEKSGRLGVMDMACDYANSQALASLLPNGYPQLLGTASSFGFGDRTGLATPGHIQAVRDSDSRMAPILAQQSIREMTRTGRTPKDVLSDAFWGAFRAGWQGAWSADADHLKDAEDIQATVESGFVFFTLDPSDHVDPTADDCTESELRTRYQAMLDDRVSQADALLPLYRGKSYDLDGAGIKIAFTEEGLLRAVVKYGRALAHIDQMNRYLKSQLVGRRGFELEISVDESEQPTSLLEHLFITLELKRLGVKFVSLAPRFDGDFEKGIDYRGDLAILEKSLSGHAAIAKQYGPYKLSLHSGSDKFSIYPLFARHAGGMLHVKTSGTSYLEALRVVLRVEPRLFRQIAEFSREHFEKDCATYHISTRLDMVPEPSQVSNTGDLESLYLDQDPGRQVLHVTFGSVLSAREGGGGFLFRDRFRNVLLENRRLHDELVARHLGRHLRLL